MNSIYIYIYICNSVFRITSNEDIVEELSSSGGAYSFGSEEHVDNVATGHVAAHVDEVASSQRQ